MVEQFYCGDSGFLPSRTIATFDPHNVPRLFWGGQLSGGAAVIYAVSKEGSLWWYRQDARSGKLGQKVRIGRQFGDWGQYQNLLATGSGKLYGVDTHGRFVRWVHSGWRDGADTWTEGRSTAGAACPGIRPVHAADDPTQYVGVLSTPPSYVYCSLPNHQQVASVLPPGVLAQSATAAPGQWVVYALTAASHVPVRMTLDIETSPAQWRIAATAGMSYSSIFVGRTVYDPTTPGPPKPYEWQWYGGLS